MNYLPGFRKDASKDSMLMTLMMGMNNLPILQTQGKVEASSPIVSPSTANSTMNTMQDQKSQSFATAAIATQCDTNNNDNNSSSSSSSWMMQANVAGTMLPQDAASIDPQVVDSMIAKELSSLTPKEREQSYMDVHGISEAVKETPELIHASQQAMELEIRRQTDNKAAYDLASLLNAAYVQNKQFRLCFLRAEMFDARKAALRFIQFFEAKLDLFGKELLTQEITQDDLEQEDMDCLYGGYAQFIKAPDRAGRAINLWISNEEHESFSTKAMLRREFYRAMLACQDEQTQRHGCVTICYFLGHGQGPNYRLDHRWTLSKLSQILPVRVAAIHLCYDNRIWMPVHAFIKASLNLFTRIRLRTHYGSHDDCLASLQGHGIPPSVLPIQAGGILSNKAEYRLTLEQHRKKERLSQPARPRIMVPSPNDVLFGKGSPVQNHVGNKKLRRLIMDCQKSYEKAEKGTKIMVAQEIVDIVLESSGRFLKPVNAQEASEKGIAGYSCGWINVENDSARTKVSAAFRTLRWKAKK